LVEEKIARECTGKFNVDDVQCQTCPDNLSCFETLVSTFQDCTVMEGNDDDDYCSSYNLNGCNYPLQQLCMRLKGFYKIRKNVCANFGTPKENPIEECLSCKQELFEECDKFDLFLQNIKLQEHEVDTLVENQLYDFRREASNCFERFAFEDTCWNGCDYKLRCLRGSGIKLDGACKYFPKDPTLLEEEIEFPVDCPNCLFYPKCVAFQEGRAIAFREETEKKKMFQNFFSIAEIRNQFVEEE